MNGWIITLAIAILPSALQAKEMCTLAQTILAPAKNNRCFDQLVSYTTNPNDRKWLLNKKATWNPPKDFRIVRVVNGALFYRGEENIGGFQWLSMNPPVLYWNNEMKIGKKSNEKSISKILHSLLHDESTGSYVYQSFLPQAEAKSANEELNEEIATIFTIGFIGGEKQAMGLLSGTATEIMKSKNDIRHSLFIYVELQSKMNCSKVGVQNFQQPLLKIGDYTPENEKDPLDTRTYYKPGDEMTEGIKTINQKSKNEFEVLGLLPNKKVYLTYLKPTKSHCTTTISTETDAKYCEKAWKDFFKINSRLEQEFRKSDYASFDCEAFKDEGKKYCYLYFEKKFPTYSAESADIKIEICEDDSCLKRTDIEELNFGEYKKFLKTHNLTAKCDINGCELPEGVKALADLQLRKQGMLLQKQTVKIGGGSTERTYFLDRKPLITHMIQSAALLGECCKSEECKKAAFDQHNIKLENSDGKPAEQ